MLVEFCTLLMAEFICIWLCGGGIYDLYEPLGQSFSKLTSTTTLCEVHYEAECFEWPRKAFCKPNSLITNERTTQIVGTRLSSVSEYCI